MKGVDEVYATVCPVWPFGEARTGFATVTNGFFYDGQRVKMFVDAVPGNCTWMYGRIAFIDGRYFFVTSSRTPGAEVNIPLCEGMRMRREHDIF